MITKTLPPITLKPSKALAVWLVVVHLGAMGCVGCLAWAWEWKLLLGTICLASLICNWRRQILLTGRHAIQTLTRLPNGDWGLEDTSLQLHRCQLLPYSLVTRPLLLLHFIAPPTRRRFYLVLLRDAFDSQVFRRLRVHILTQR